MKSAIELVVQKVFIAYQDDKYSYIRSFEGSEGLKRLVKLAVDKEKLDTSSADSVYEIVMSILDEIAVNPESEVSRKYKNLYADSVYDRATSLLLKLRSVSA